MTSNGSGSPRGLNALLFLFIGSGCAALIYEVVWYQSLALIVGSNAVSMAVVLATYMGGMGLGSLAYLRWRRRTMHPLLVYARLEIVIAIAGLLVLFVLPWAGGLYTAVGGGGFRGVLLRGLFCAIFLLAPCMAMGATLPAASAWLSGTPQGVSRIGFYYALNIAGGVIGALISGFYLLRVYDNATATYVAVSLNILVAAVAWFVARSSAYLAPSVAQPVAADALRHRAVYLSIGLSGACALGAQVVWSRNLALLLGGTVYTFALILGAMLLGLGIGSGIGATTARSVVNPRRALGLCQVLAMAGLAWAAWSLTDALPNWPINPQLAPSVWFVYQLDFVRALWVVLPASLCWGASFPLAIAAVAAGEANSSRAVARIYAANTAGAILGALVTGLLLIRWIGTQSTQQLLMVLALVAALLMWLPAAEDAAARWGRANVAPMVLSVALLFVTIPFVHPVPGLLVGYGRWAVTWLQSHGEFIYVGEGLNSSLAVSRMADGTTNYHNAGKVQASSTPDDMRLQRMLGHLTTLLARDPKKVMVIGCGAGVTAGAVSISPAVKDQTIVEIEPLVPRVVSTFFSKENHGVIGNPKVKVRLDDARHFLLTTDEKFDAITTDPFDTWVKGAATLNTLEFYTEMRRHLNPGGVVTVWIQFYETDTASFKSELATFMKVFPNTAVFGNTAGGQGYDGVLVGSVEPLKIDLNAIDARLHTPEYAPVLQSLSDVNYGSVQSLFGTFAAHGSQLTEYLADAQINRDRNLRLQYLAGMALNRYDQSQIYGDLQKHGGWVDGVFSGDEATLEELRTRIESQRRP